MVEIDNIFDFKRWISTQLVSKAAIQEISLIGFDDEILTREFKDCMFLGCEMNDLIAGHIVRTGGLVIPNSKYVDFQIHRAFLYDPKELFMGFDLNNNEGYQSTLDYKIYKDYVKDGMENPKSIYTSLMRRLHDHSITDALQELIEGRKVVAVMGGHGMERSDSFYTKIAKISRSLTKKGYLLVSGGGPGAMEATHLGAYFACRTELEMLNAIDEIKIRPKNAEIGKEYEDEDWLHRSWRIMEKYPLSERNKNESMSIGIPTWLYGHEPPAPFATHIAKYFANSVREDGLLTIAKHGVIFAPGSAGTIQEIFQDNTQNYYAAYNNTTIKKYVSPMILTGVDHWTIENPLWSLLKKLSDGRPYGKILSLTDNENIIVDKIVSYDPAQFAF